LASFFLLKFYIAILILSFNNKNIQENLEEKEKVVVELQFRISLQNKFYSWNSWSNQC